MQSTGGPSIAVIGAGFSGTLLTLRLLRHCPPTTRVQLIDRSGQFGRGVAYATDNPCHLLNVPAGNMSAFADRPLHFLQWLQTRPHDADPCDAVSEPPSTATFAPRRLFGAYMRHTIQEETRDPGMQDRLTLVNDDVAAVELGRPLTLRLASGTMIEADIAVLATGNARPAPIHGVDPPLEAVPIYRADPWSPDALTQLDPDRAVLLVGTGLTAIDAIISLLDQGHAGPIHALSRRGLLPLRHDGSGYPQPPDQTGYPTELAPLVRAIRERCARAVAAGGNWRSVIDGLRPFTQDLWQMASHEDRARFMRHIRPWWDVHRHRIAGPIADRIERARSSGQLQVHAGHIEACHVGTDNAARVIYRPRGADTRVSLEVARVVNCSGPASDCSRSADPLFRHLLEAGVVRSDTVRLGLDVSITCALITSNGTVSQQLFAVGPVTKGRFWETTAVPDIRHQCERLALHLATLAKALATAPRPVFASARALVEAD